MSFWQIYLICAGGIVISVLLPIIRQYLPKATTASLKGTMSAIKTYLILGLFSLLTALLIVALTGDTLQDWRAAMLAGYAWDSTLQKFKG